MAEVLNTRVSALAAGDVLVGVCGWGVSRDPRQHMPTVTEVEQRRPIAPVTSDEPVVVVTMTMGENVEAEFRFYDPDQTVLALREH